MNKKIISFSLFFILILIWFSSINISLPSPTQQLKIKLKASSGEAITSPMINRYSFGVTSLSDIPPFLIQALIAAEDKRFFSHPGVDIIALGNATFTNIKNFKIVRGGSTITEQVARIILGEERNLLGRIKVFFAALKLDRSSSKDSILKFYLSNVSFPGNVKGIEDGARVLFGRDLKTLTKKEILALVSVIRSPEKLNPHKHGQKRIEKRIIPILNSLEELQVINEIDKSEIQSQELIFDKSSLVLRAPHFARAVYKELESKNIQSNIIETALDSSLQRTISDSLTRTLNIFSSQGAVDGAALVVDIKSGGVKAWASSNKDTEVEIDSVLSLRQPGSTLKPFLYAAAFDRGLSPSAIINDSPLFRPVGEGIKSFRNYSRTFYGPILVREALGNSLNIPAVEIIHKVGIPEFLKILHELGFSSLTKDPNFYGEGLALGNGEVSLLELVRGYLILAKGGEFSQIKFFKDEINYPSNKRIFSKTSSALVTDILSDPEARSREFGDEVNISIPYSFAYKTGTSTDFHDAWAVGYSKDFVVGVWIGDLTRKPMKEVTGSKASAMLVRSIFTELGRLFGAAPLKHSKLLENVNICPVTGKLAGKGCAQAVEKFPVDSLPKEICQGHEEAQNKDGEFKIVMPTPGLKIAIDPRIPASLQKITFKAKKSDTRNKLSWILNNQNIGEGDEISWRLTKGSFDLKILDDSGKEADGIRFYVR